MLAFGVFVWELVVGPGVLFDVSVEAFGEDV